MAITLKVSGDDLTGEFDSELTAANPLIVAEAISGVPWYKVSSSAATKIIGKSPLGSPSTTYFGFAFRKTGNPASSQVFLHPFTSAGATSFRLRLSSTGTIIMDGASTNTLDTSSVLANNTTYALIGQVSATAMTVTIYAADGTTVVDTITATNTFGLVDNWRMGQIGGSPAIPDWYFRMLLVGDTAITAPTVLATPTTLGTPRIGIIGDSNTGGSGDNGYYFDALDAASIDTRNIYFWGVGGKRISVADLTGKTAANNITDAAAWLGTIDTWIVALGTNDRPQVDATINADIDTLLTAIGGTAKVIWIGLTSKATASADDIRVNNLIQAKLTARGNATFADWDTHIRTIDGGSNPSPYWLTTDSTHMTALGYAERAAFYVDQLADDTPVEVDGTGTLTVTGSATRSISVARSASGALAIVGAATPTVTVARTATGSLTLAGTATRAISVTRTATGTLTINGTAQHATTVTRSASGVLELSGTATTAGSTERTANGSLAISGTATPTVTIARTATGTLTLTGTAPPAVTIAREANGTLALGGIGTYTFHVIRTALGILTMNGSGAINGEQPEWPARLTLNATIDTLNLTATVPELTLEATW